MPSIELSTLVVSFILSLAFVPLVRRLCFRVGRVAQPRKDRWHNQPTPNLGGLGMFGAYAFAVGIGLLLSAGYNGQLEARWSLLAGSVIMFVLGLYDDFKRITPPVKLAGQLLAAIIVIFFGDNTIDFFPWPIANIILTFFWLIGITNAVNLLDNMDGLAGGVSCIAAGVLSYFFWRGNYTFLLTLSLSLVGGTLGFLMFNFPPAKIFMGDSGSQFLGFTLASLAIARRTQASNVFAVVGVPTLLFLLPILDTSLVTITRLLRGQSPVQGGTDHTSHRLIAFGLTERQAVIFLYGVALVSGVAAASLEALDYDLSLVLIPLLLIGLSLFVAYLGRLKVITSYTPSQGAITRLMADLTYRRRLFEIILDLLLIGISYYLAFWTRYGLNMTSLSMDLFLKSWPIALILAYFSFFVFGVYRGVWRYVGFNDLVRYGEATLAAVLVAYLVDKVIYPNQPYTLDVFIFYAVFLFLGLAGSRSSFQILDRLYGRQRNRTEKTNVLLFGAQDAGEIALRWILRNPDLGYNPVGFLDNDPYLEGRSIHSVVVLGGIEKLDEVLQSKDVNGIIVTSSAMLTSEEGDKLIDICRGQGVWVRILKLEFELIE
jgi:UDP-GlcNAc:undecaprenyl-phosphate GlcNAc-1-phosphate transferase